MLFIHPMWDHESERIGKQKCTPIGYAIHLIADLIGFVGLIGLFVVPGVLVMRWFHGTFHASLLWLLGVPVCLGIIGKVLYEYSWWLARRKGFRYDYARCEASWLEAGERRSYKYPG